MCRQQQQQRQEAPAEPDDSVRQPGSSKHLLQRQRLQLHCHSPHCGLERNQLWHVSLLLTQSKCVLLAERIPESGFEGKGPPEGVDLAIFQCCRCTLALNK